MYNLAIRKCTSPPLLAPRLKIFIRKFTTPPGIEPQTCYHLSHCGEPLEKYDSIDFKARFRLSEGTSWPGSGFFGFSDKCEMCLRVVGGNNYIFYVIYKCRSTVILSRIFAKFLHFCEILNIRDKNETFYFLTIFIFTSRYVKLKQTVISGNLVHQWSDSSH